MISPAVVEDRTLQNVQKTYTYTIQALRKGTKHPKKNLKKKMKRIKGILTDVLQEDCAKGLATLFQMDSKLGDQVLHFQEEKIEKIKKKQEKR